MPSRTSDPSAEQSTSADTAGRLRVAIHRLNRLLRQQAQTELTLTKLVHLATIDREGPITLGDLATAEQVAPPTVTKVVKELEALGLVERLPDPDDRRVVRVDTTKAGHTRLVDSRTRKDQWLSRQLAVLSDDELAALLRALPVLERLTEPQSPGL